MFSPSISSTPEQKKTSRFYRNHGRIRLTHWTSLGEVDKNRGQFSFFPRTIIGIGDFEFNPDVAFHNLWTYDQLIGLGCTNIWDHLGHRDHPNFRKRDMNSWTYQPTKRPMATSRMDSIPWSGAVTRLETSHREMARKGYPPAKATRMVRYFFGKQKLASPRLRKVWNMGCLKHTFPWFPPVWGRKSGRFLRVDKYMFFQHRW